MEDEILDYNWVISHELPLKKEERTLFQQYFNEESLVLVAAMLHDNNITYHVKIDNPESKKFGNLIHEIHLNEENLEKANELLRLLLDEDQNYPIKRYLNTPLRSLQFLLEENENVYTQALVKMELKRRGVEIPEPEEGAKDLIPFIILVSTVFILLLIYQFLKEVTS